LNGTVAGDVRYLVQAVNGVGLVALDSKSSAYHRLDEVESRIGAATAVILLTPPTSGAYGTSVSCRARLTSNGLPLAGIGLRFSLGGQEASADTDANGVASGRLNVLTLPGQYQLQVAFRGGSGYAASFATSPFTITKQATSITLAPATTVIRPGLDPKIVATLFDAAGRRLVERTVIIVVMGTGGSYALPSITDFLGRAPLGPVSLPSGNYTVSAYFAGTVPLPPPNLPVSMIDDSYEQSSASVSLVIDSQAPVITSLSANPSVLRPPNHQMVLVTVNVTASDSSGPATCKITAVTSNESVNGLGDGDQEPDWAIAGDLSVYLRAERAQNGPGRTYTITVTCTDLAGNSTNGTATVFAPK